MKLTQLAAAARLLSLRALRAETLAVARTAGAATAAAPSAGCRPAGQLVHPDLRHDQRRGHGLR